ncbi:MAG: hypothetical protein O3A82_15965 [Verrucomicrobia bacterium]|jgi:hypothetical protein|nr:hypothetical protein [Verrucomicrobiota bacterium]MDA0723739.1 hypothetical protein [Verrucomicrobiota bacterium]MDA1048407.1 hypothetical protein [Verrucomicrobiota bacterium]
MPDIPFDSLIVVLLVLASIFGKFFKKKINDEGDPPPSPRQPAERPESDEEEDNAPQLRDVLRDFWKKNRAGGEQEYQRYEQRIEPIPQESVVAPPPPRVTSKDPSPDQKIQTRPETSDQAAYRQQGATDHQDATKKNLKAFDIGSGKTNALSQSIVSDLRSPDSLRKALVLREILGPPVSLRDGKSGNSGI